MLSPKSVLITGCSRGAGLGFVDHFVKLDAPPSHVFATCRSPERAKALRELAAANSSVSIVKLDVTDLASIEAARAVVESTLEGEGLNLLINNAAIDETKGIYNVTMEDMMDHYRTNCVGPLMVTKAFLPLLKKAACSDGNSPMSCSKAAVVNISSEWASITDNDFSGEIPYKASKAALSMVSSNLAIELKSDSILVVSIDPDWMKTDMGGPDAKISVDESIAGILRVLSTLKGPDDTGKFLTYKGELLRW